MNLKMIRVWPPFLDSVDIVDKAIRKILHDDGLQYHLLMQWKLFRLHTP